MAVDFEFIFGKALIFARLAHGEQKRKYTGEPYVVHCRAVAELVLEHTGMTALTTAAILHDCIEDTSVTAYEIEWFFGSEVSDLVLEVTDVSKPEDGNRALRKALDLEHLSRSSPGGASIKLADLIDNTRSIVQYDPGFAVRYLEEKRALLPVLKHGNENLHMIATQSLIEAENRLANYEVPDVDSDGGTPCCASR